MRSVALSRPAYALGETGEIPSNDTATDYPSPPVFSLNELLPALRAKQNIDHVKTLAMGVLIGGFFGWIGTSAFHSKAFRK